MRRFFVCIFVFIFLISFITNITQAQLSDKGKIRGKEIRDSATQAVATGTAGPGIPFMKGAYKIGGSLAGTAGKIIQNLLQFLGVLALGYVVYGGFLYITAHGESGQVDKAKSVLRNGVIGLILISLAYAISAVAIARILYPQIK